MSIAGRTAWLSLAALVAWWIGPPALADDDLPAPGEVRLFWEMEAFRAPPSVPNDHMPRRFIEQIVPTADSGLLVLVSQYPQRFFIVKLDHEGHEQWRVSDLICPPTDRHCTNWDSSSVRIAPTPHGAVIAMMNGGRWVNLYDAGGRFIRQYKITRLAYPHLTMILPGSGGTFYFAGSYNAYSFTSPETGGLGGHLVRWSPETGPLWDIRQPFAAYDTQQYARALDLDLMINDDVLWTLDGEPAMRLDPGGYWQVRVTEDGTIRTVGELETTVQGDHGQWWIYGSAILPDGYLLRFGRVVRYEDMGRVRMEFWDRLGARMIGYRLIDDGDNSDSIYEFSGLRYLDARGNHYFYMIGIGNDPGLEISGFDTDAKPAWKLTIGDEGVFEVVGDGSTNRVLIAGYRPQQPGRYLRPSIKITAVD